MPEAECQLLGVIKFSVQLDKLATIFQPHRQHRALQSAKPRQRQQAFHQYADHWQPGKGIAEPLLAQAKRGIVFAALCGVAQSGGEMAFWQAAAQALDINLALALTRTA